MDTENTPERDDPAEGAPRENDSMVGMGATEEDMQKHQGNERKPQDTPEKDDPAEGFDPKQGTGQKDAQGRTIEQTRPPLGELNDLADQDATKPHTEAPDEEYDPADDITPG